MWFIGIIFIEKNSKKEDGYHIKNKLRLTIGSRSENLAFMNAVKNILS